MLLTLGYSNVRAFFFKTKWYGYRLETCVGIIIHLDIHVVSCHWWFISSLLKDHWFFFTVKNVYWFSFMPWPILKMKRYTTKVLASTGKVVSFLLSPSTGLYFLSSWLLELKKNNHFQVQIIWWCLKDECQLPGCTQFFRLAIFDSVWHEIVSISWWLLDLQTLCSRLHLWFSGYFQKAVVAGNWLPVEWTGIGGPDAAHRFNQLACIVYICLGFLSLLGLNIFTDQFIFHCNVWF